MAAAAKRWRLELPTAVLTLGLEPRDAFFDPRRRAIASQPYPKRARRASGAGGITHALLSVKARLGAA